MKVTVGIIAKNEELSIQECILTVKDIADEVIVIDDYSQDATEKKAREAGAIVYKRRLDNFSNQKNYLLTQSGRVWVLILDADERLDPALKEAIRKIPEDTAYSGFKMLRKNYIFGKELKHGGNGNDWVVRLMRREKASFVNAVHEKVVIRGTVGRLSGGTLHHHSTPTLSSYVKKLNQYTDLEAGMIQEKRFLFFRLMVIPGLVFLKRYIAQLGFLDGIEGFIYAVLCSVYSFVKYAKAV